MENLNTYIHQHDLDPIDFNNENKKSKDLPYYDELLSFCISFF